MRLALVTVEDKLEFGPAPYTEASKAWVEKNSGEGTCFLYDLVMIRRKKLTPAISKEYKPVKTMKKTLALFVATLMLSAFSAHAQRYSTYVVSTLCSNIQMSTVITNGVGPCLTNTVTGVGTGSRTIDVRLQDNVAVTVCTRLAGANVLNAKISFERSLDNSSYDADNPIVIRPESVGTNSAMAGWTTYTTNLPCEGIGYLRLKTIANVDTNGILTNTFLLWSVKR